MSDELLVRLATDGDADAIRRVEKAAFGQDAESAIVDAMRGTDDELFSIVGELDGHIVAHSYSPA